MSRYAYFACMDCKVARFIGKAIMHEDGQVNYFHIGPVSEPLNWERFQLNQVIWKMLADHAGHHLQVIMSWDPEFELIAHFTVISETSGSQDISVEEYLEGWDGAKKTDNEQP